MRLKNNHMYLNSKNYVQNISIVNHVHTMLLSANISIKRKYFKLCKNAKKLGMILKNIHYTNFNSTNYVQNISIITRDEVQIFQYK